MYATPDILQVTIRFTSSLLGQATIRSTGSR